MQFDEARRNAAASPGESAAGGAIMSRPAPPAPASAGSMFIGEIDTVPR